MAVPVHTAVPDDGAARPAPVISSAIQPATPATPSANLPAGERVQPDRDWFARTGLEVARDLLGAHLTRRGPDGDVTVRIVEVEAYQGEQDPGSHAFHGRTARNEVMFGAPGRLYTYRHLGLHTCMNVVCGPEGQAAAVLLRAGEVIAGEPLARGRRLAQGTVTRPVDLARGPARLTVALGVTMADNGRDLLAPGSEMTILVPGRGSAEDAAVGPASGTAHGAQSAGAAISSGPRVGVSGAGGDGTRFPWRLWLTGEPAVSAYRAAPAPRPRSGSRSR